LDIRRRFTIALRRALAAQIGVPTRQLCRLLRLSFAKVAEMQQRAAVHYHAVIRLDRPDDGWQPPHFDVTADQLEAAIRTAATKVHLNAPEIGRQLRWGDQVDVQPISRHGELHGELTAEKVAVYLSKYVVKSGARRLRARRDRRRPRRRPPPGRQRPHRDNDGHHRRSRRSR
jgi:hypothetical protein